MTRGRPFPGNTGAARRAGQRDGLLPLRETRDNLERALTAGMRDAECPRGIQAIAAQIHRTLARHLPSDPSWTRAESKNPDHRMAAECRDRYKVLGLDTRLPSDPSEPLRYLGRFPSVHRLGSYRGITPNHSSIQARRLVEATEELCGSGFA